MIRHEISCDHCGILVRHTAGTVETPFLGYEIQPKGDDRIITVVNANKADCHICRPCLDAFSRFFQTSKTIGMEGDS